jgi:hypothetical protein
MKVKVTLRLLAPYIAVLVFWCLLSSAWLAVLAYHAQILFWLRAGQSERRRPARRRRLLLALPATLVGPLLYGLLPCMTDTALPAWLANHHLSGLSFALMIPYFGLVHPLLEQRHWAPLRESTPLAHPLFAGYHILVLHSLLALPWLLVCFAVLTGASVAWQQMARRSGSLAGPVASHVLADVGVVVAAWLRA